MCSFFPRLALYASLRVLHNFCVCVCSLVVIRLILPFYHSHTHTQAHYTHVLSRILFLFRRYLFQSLPLLLIVGVVVAIAGDGGGVSFCFSKSQQDIAFRAFMCVSAKVNLFFIHPHFALAHFFFLVRR